ncbi:MAG: bifunctional [glutamate--ammonia ligase]-adenylyl-L-tyrosine phosphorylase/[glutamate--ammonia-ligase] adenylyltransferase [Planctomycetia bacterium]|nr:bifunctional [glutamate--ammonia ligase]-adenylyl-L-tyrosine phosphorylase/[glutamate--ammonia-ligase] adenylyltransferase [Planctomycetia bacterium]
MATTGPSARADAVTARDLRRLLVEPERAAAWGKAAGVDDPAAARRHLAELAGLGLPDDLLAALLTGLAEHLPQTSDPQRVAVAVERFFTTVRSPLGTAALFHRDPRALGILLSIFSASPHLAEIVIADPESWEEVRVGGGRPVGHDLLAAALDGELAPGMDPEMAIRGLRRFRRRELLRIAYGDIVGGQRLETVVSQLSLVAETIVAAALGQALQRQETLRGVPRGPAGERATLAVVALGKLGGGELNYSSDIDLVLVHSADGRVDGERPCTNQEFFTRVTQDLVRLLAESSDAGIGYRVDLRLRPHGGSGPLSMALDTLLQYVDREGRTWERQAWVKARCVAGDKALGARLLGQLEPWIYNRWLTRSDISGIQALKRRIEVRAAREGAGAEDVKQGRGGIRDIEFTIQFLQLLNGGDTPLLRTGSTLEAIRRLTETGVLTDQEREVLERTYSLLRTVEHRLQILYDRQTHSLPVAAREREQLAVRLGFGTGAAGAECLSRELAEAMSLNRRIVDHLLHDAFPDDRPPAPEVDLLLDPAPPAGTVERILAGHGFADVPAAWQTLRALAEERVRFLSSRRCRHFLAAIAPRLLAAIATTPDPDASLTTLGAVADSLGGKGVLWELFSFHPPSLDLTVRLCASSPFLAGLLVGNPGMIDELLDGLMIDELPAPEAVGAELVELCRGAVDPEPILHAFKASQQLRIGVRDILGRGDVAAVTAALSAIPAAILPVVVAREEARLVERLGEPLAGEGATAGRRAGAVVLAMGKFGGGEMNYASDVDVMFLYDHDGQTCHGRRGRRSAEGTTNAHFFGELAQRTTRLFNRSTASGRLYEMDSRLRPAGRSGAAAISLDELARYFAPDGPATVTERQALLKARVVVGAPEAAARALEIVGAASYGHAWTAADVAALREARLRLEAGAKATNLKRGPGGMVDIECIVQVLQLVHGGGDPRLRSPQTLAGLVALQAAGHVADDEFRFLEAAYRRLRLIEGRLRLLDATARHDFPAAPAEQRRLAHLLSAPDATSLLAELEELTAGIRRCFDSVFDRTGAGLASG